MINTVIDFDTKQELLDKREYDIDEREDVLEKNLHLMNVNEALACLNYEEIKYDLNRKIRKVSNKLNKLNQREQALLD